MKTPRFLLITFSLSLGLGLFAQEQSNSTAWSLDKCIAFSLEKNIDVRKTAVVTDVDQQLIKQKQGLRYTNLSAGVDEGIGLTKVLNNNNRFGNYTSSKTTDASLNSNVTLYNGFKINNSIKQAQLAYKASIYDAATTKENITLSVLNDYLQVIYAKELVNTSAEQIKSTTEQMKLAEERVTLGLLSRADYLTLKAQLANAKLILVNAESSYALAKLALMQLMEFPVTSEFDIVYPDLSSFKNSSIVPDAEVVYKTALDIKPQIKSAALNKNIADLSVKIARADLYPRLSLSGSVSTLYGSTFPGLSYSYQLENRLTPSVDLTLSIPILQQNQVKTAIQIAKLNTETAALNDINTRDQLRKAIEQASLNFSSAQTKYQASQEKYDATKEAYEVSVEKFKLGLLSSSDFIIQETNLFSAESDLLQSKVNLIFSNKILDFYTGIPITL